MRLKHNAKKVNQNIIQSDSKLSQCQIQINKKDDEIKQALLYHDQQQIQEQIVSMIDKNNKYANKDQQVQRLTQNCQSPSMSQKQYQNAIKNYKKCLKKSKNKIQNESNKEKSQQNNIKTQTVSLRSFSAKQRLAQSISIINKCKKKTQNIQIISQFRNSPSILKALTSIQNLKQMESDLQKKQFQLLSIQEYFKRQNNKTQLSSKSTNLNVHNQSYGYNFRPKISKQAKRWFSNQKKHLKTQQIQLKSNGKIFNLLTKSQNNCQLRKSFQRSKSLPNNRNNNQISIFLKNKKSIQVENIKQHPIQIKKNKKLIQQKQKSNHRKTQKSKEQLNFKQQKLILKPKQNKIFQYPWNWIKYQFSPNLHAKQWK